MHTIRPVISFNRGSQVNCLGCVEATGADASKDPRDLSSCGVSSRVVQSRCASFNGTGTTIDPDVPVP